MRLFALMLLLWATTGGQAQYGVDVAKLKIAAEQGNPIAQKELGDAYSSHFDFAEAAKWYRLAADQGLADAQCKLGKMLLTGRPAMKTGSAKLPQDIPEGVNLLYRAANQGHKQAQLELGHCYGKGTGVQMDLVHAYKWYSLAARTDNLLRDLYLNPLALKMTSAQIAQGEQLARAFTPSKNPPPLQVASPLAKQLVLKGISGPVDRRLAVINNETFAAGEEREVKVGKSKVKVKCYEIRASSILVGIAGADEQIELALRKN